MDIQPKSITSYDSVSLHAQSTPREGDYLCVYGTLRNHLTAGRYGMRAGVLSELEYLGTCRLYGIAMHADMSASFPYCAVTHDPEHSVVVEQYLLDGRMDSILGITDGIEGAPHFYHRTSVLDDSGQTRWLYTVSLEEAEASYSYLPSGDWNDIVASELRYAW